MELIKEIYDDDKSINSNFKVREASRAILFDENDKIALLYVGKFNYHKLPGGGIDEGEDKSQALVRECLEEVGAEIEIKGEVGKIVEYRTKYNLKQISYCYYGKIISKGKSNFTQKEIDEKFSIKWISLNEAISKIENDKPSNYEGEFIQKRDLEFLKKNKNNIKIKINFYYSLPSLSIPQAASISSPILYLIKHLYPFCLRASLNSSHLFILEA